MLVARMKGSAIRDHEPSPGLRFASSGLRLLSLI